MSRAYEIARDLALTLEAQHRSCFDVDALAEDAGDHGFRARRDIAVTVRCVRLTREGMDRIAMAIKAAMREAAGSAR